MQRTRWEVLQGAAGGRRDRARAELSAGTEALCHVWQKPQRPAHTSLLYGESDTHEERCLTPKLRTPRTHEQLFTDIDFHFKVDLTILSCGSRRSRIILDPLRVVRTHLLVGHPEAVTVEGVRGGG